MKREFLLIALLIGISGPGSGIAADWAWVMSVPHAISDEFVYKVRIVAIDGEAQQELLRYPLSPGRHEVTVELMLDLEWEPDLTEGAQRRPVKQLALEAESGKSYLLAGKVDVNAPVESQLDGSWWEVIVYAEQ